MVGRDQYGCITPAFSWSPWWGEINMATQPLPSRGPHGGERSIWLHNPCLLRVPMVGADQYGYITPAFLGSPWWGEINMATQPLPSWGPRGGERSIWLHNPCLLRVPMVGRDQYGYITLAFLGSPWWGAKGDGNWVVENWGKLGDNSNMPHPKCMGSLKKKPSME